MKKEDKIVNMAFDDILGDSLNILYSEIIWEDE